MVRASVLAILACVFLLAITFDVSVFASVASNPYVDSKNQFSINPPSGWTVDTSGAYGTAVILYGPTDSNFRINMNVVVEATSLSLGGYVSAAKTQLSTSLTNYQLVSEASITIGGVAAYNLVNTFTQGSYSIKDEQDVLVQNQNAYIITSTALQSNYATYQPAFDESAQTFKATGSAFPWTIVVIGAVIAAGVAIGLTVFFVRRKGQVNIPPTMPQPLPSTPPEPAP